MNYYMKEVIPYIRKGDVLLTGDSALVYSGMSIWEEYTPDVLTTVIELKGLSLYGLINYCYTTEIDYINYVIRYDKLLVPTKERAIVENIKLNLEYVDEGHFVESLSRYIHSPEYNYPLLTEVAKHFNVPMETVDYWIGEAEDYAR